MTPESERLLLFLCKDPEYCGTKHQADCLLYRDEMRERLATIEDEARAPLVTALRSVYSVHGPSGLDCECKGCFWYRDDAAERALAAPLASAEPECICKWSFSPDEDPVRRNDPTCPQRHRHASIAAAQRIEHTDDAATCRCMREV